MGGFLFIRFYLLHKQGLNPILPRCSKIQYLKKTGLYDKE
jgi:hypothetical protein